MSCLADTHCYHKLQVRDSAGIKLLCHSAYTAHQAQALFYATLEAAEIHIVNISTILSLFHSSNFNSLAPRVCPHTLHCPQFSYCGDHAYFPQLSHMSPKGQEVASSG